jgi:pimeloyl-ACP methyl ester carboxylesterase
MRRSVALARIVIVSLIALFLSTSVAGTVGTAPTASAVPPPVGQIMTQTYSIDGVQVIRWYMNGRPSLRPPVIVVHGGMHGAWVFDMYAYLLVEYGHEVYAFNWLNHAGSMALPQEQWVARGIAEVAHREIRTVALSLPVTPILIGHSMGGLAALEYAANYPVRRLVLIAPVVPASIGGPVIPLAVDLTQPFPVFPYSVAKELFFPTMTDTDAQGYYARLQPESPRAVWEASRWTVPVNLAAITAPTLAISAGLDPIVPASIVTQLATAIGAELQHYSNLGHSDLLLSLPGAAIVADHVAAFTGRG